MALFTYMTLLAFLHITFAEDCVINNMPERMAFEKQLKKDLECVYDVKEPPSESKNRSTLIVNVRFVMKRFNFYSNKDVLVLQTWMFLSWKDEKLKWDPKKYYGIEETEMTSISIWTPGFTLFNSANSNDFDIFYYTWCQLENTGQVRCVPKITHEAICNVKLANWPYDQQECSFEFGPYNTKWFNFKMNFTSRAISMLGAEYEAEWFISDYRQEANYSSERQLKMIFVLDREATGLAARVVYPAVILSVLSVTCLFLDVRRNVRLAITCFSLYGHYYFLMGLAADLPRQTSDSPNLLIYYRGSVILTVLVILITFLLGIICKLKSMPQKYVLTTNNLVYESFGKYFVFPQWNIDDVDSMIDSKQFSQDWTKFANIINTVFLVIIIIAYIIMYLALMPQPIPVNYD